jgi:predicted metal-dependent hydrolase
MRFGVYCPETRHIRIHPALDQAFVPRYFVEFIVYHELLHHVMPAVQVGGRYYAHTEAFRQRERAFPRYAEAVAWRQRHLRQLLASHPGRGTRRPPRSR